MKAPAANWQRGHFARSSSLRWLLACSAWVSSINPKNFLDVCRRRLFNNFGASGCFFPFEGPGGGFARAGAFGPALPRMAPAAAGPNSSASDFPIPASRGRGPCKRPLTERCQGLRPSCSSPTRAALEPKHTDDTRIVGDRGKHGRGGNSEGREVKGPGGAKTLKLLRRGPVENGDYCSR